MTIGLFGGTFDPVHRGHLDVALAARSALSLDQVWFVPAHQPPHRTPPGASAPHRFAMLALATAGHEGLLVSDLEMDATGPSYTIDTLARIESARPAVAHSTVFITGADAFRDIRTWRSYGELLDRCHFAVVSRPGCPAGTMRDLLPDLAPRMRDAPCNLSATPGIFLVDALTAAVSSTEVRRALGEGRPLAGLVPEPVASYLRRHSLYGAQDTRETSEE